MSLAELEAELLEQKLQGNLSEIRRLIPQVNAARQAAKGVGDIFSRYADSLEASSLLVVEAGEYCRILPYWTALSLIEELMEAKVASRQTFIDWVYPELLAKNDDGSGYVFTPARANL